MYLKKNIMEWWIRLPIKWQRQLFLNYLLSQCDIKWRIKAFLDDSFGLEFILCKALNIETKDPNRDLDSLDKFIKAKLGDIQTSEIIKTIELKEIILNGLDNLKHLEVFSRLELVYLDHCKTTEINQLPNLQSIVFYESPEYPTNSPSFYQESNSFISKVNIDFDPIDSIKKHFSKKFKLKLSEPYNSRDAISYLKHCGYKENYIRRYRHYSIENHTLIVCNVFEKYFKHDWKNLLSLSGFRLLLLLHDIGKYESNFKQKNKQSECTIAIINDIEFMLPLEKGEFQTIKKIISSDYLGLFFKKKKLRSQFSACTKTSLSQSKTSFI